MSNKEESKKLIEFNQSEPVGRMTNAMSIMAQIEKYNKIACELNKYTHFEHVICTHDGQGGVVVDTSCRVWYLPRTEKRAFLELKRESEIQRIRYERLEVELTNYTTRTFIGLVRFMERENLGKGRLVIPKDYKTETFMFVRFHGQFFERSRDLDARCFRITLEKVARLWAIRHCIFDESEVIKEVKTEAEERGRVCPG